MQSYSLQMIKTDWVILSETVKLPVYKEIIIFHSTININQKFLTTKGV